MDIIKKLTPVERIKKLQEERKSIFQLPPEKALDAILSSPHALPLVHSFPEQDLYFLMHDIGAEDFLPVLSMASSKQWEYILDIESWEKDRFRMKALTYWLGLLAEADLNRLVKWVLEEKLELIEFYIFKNVEVRIREHDQDPSDFGDGFFTIDNTFYIRFHDLLLEDPLEHEVIKGQREALLYKLFNGMAGMDHLMFQKVLMESTSMIQAEFEEEAYRLRNVRLSEKGFLPFDEALGIYYPISPDDMENQGRRHLSKTSASTVIPVAPMTPVKMLENDNVFSRSLSLITTEDILTALEAEFVALCNQIAVADRKTIREKAELRETVKKACGFISIGLETLNRESGGPASELSSARMAAMLEKFPLINLFRVGYGRVLEVKRRADRWARESWFQSMELPLSFWDEQWMGIIGGLLIKRPLFFDNLTTGVLYREFANILEVDETENALEQIIALDQMLALCTIRLDHFSAEFLTYKNLLLTLWAADELGLKNIDGPLAFRDFKRFFSRLFQREVQVYESLKDDIPDYTISLALRSAFLNWLSEKTGLTDFEISRKLAKTLEKLFAELESEYGRVPLKHLDPKFIRHFCIRSEDAGDRSESERI